MSQFLILKLDGVLQAWGDHTYEDYRPTVGFPTRSGLLGLLGAALGLERSDHEAQQRLAASVYFTVRADTERNRKILRPVRITDFHTVQEARKVNGKASEYPVVSRREYLCDAVFTVAVEATEEPMISLSDIATAIRQPVYTLSLGRRSCPLSRPLFETTLEAAHAKEALNQVPPVGGVIYSESPALATDKRLRLRDVPLYGKHRQFATRELYIHVEGGSHVSE